MSAPTSSPSLSTAVPARSTTANTITAHSSRRTDIVMLAKAGSWCMNSSSCSEGERERDRLGDRSGERERGRERERQVRRERARETG